MLRNFSLRITMFKLHDVLCLFIVFCECVFHVKSVPCRGTASYKLQFQAEWKNTTSRPAGAGFSGLIGCSHNKCYRMWKPGEKASLGVKNVAERGNYKELSSEIQKHIEKWKTASERLKTNNNTIGPEAQVLLPETYPYISGFAVDKSRPLVSVIARIIPSPDWFIGVHDVSLCNKSGHWLPEIIITIFPYDAGTARTSTHNDSIVVQSSPRQNIRQLQVADISDSVRGMGYMRFTLVRKSESGSSVVVIDEDNCPNMASLTKVSSLVWFALIATILLIKS